MANKRIKIGDIAVYCLAAVLAFAPLFGIFSGSDVLSVEIYQGGVLHTSVALPHDEVYVIGGDYKNTITIHGTSVSFTHSTCPTQTCVLSGSISRAGQVIACVPNGVVVRIVGRGGLDAVVG